jgi:2-phospho-L-lactate transferase/gluconeogenesis factor (CofD/UPF0052 family)
MRAHRLEGNKNGRGLNVQTAVDEYAELMMSKSRILVDSLTPYDIVLQDGNTRVFGQSAVDAHIVTSENPNHVQLLAVAREPFGSVPANPAALESIENSQILVTSAGSVFGSIKAAFTPEGMSRSVQRAQKNGQKLIIMANLAQDKKNVATMDAVKFVETIEDSAGRRADLLVGNRNTTALGEDVALVVEREELTGRDGFKVLTADLVADTDVQYDQNNPKYKTGSKVKSRFDVQAALALTERPELERVA